MVILQTPWQALRRSCVELRLEPSQGRILVGLKLQGLGFGVQGFQGLEARGLGFKVQGLQGLEARGLGFGVQGFRV